MFTNKHVVTALIVAPILAILSYFAVGYWVAEPPQKVEAGGNYKLAEKPNCRYTSGVCELKNGDFEVRILPQELSDGAIRLSLTSTQPLDGAKIALVEQDNENNTKPMNWQSIDDDRQQWQVDIHPSSAEQQLQLVFSFNEALFFGETQLTFIEYETTFEKDFRR
ncbi:hypothetical protein [Sessilibacter corallicola]|uniref:Secreted protein n=1 Tax=Sessilibacter corallicola TaxID=2904075 RepID=A0ABQ0AED2_9GAMM